MVSQSWYGSLQSDRVVLSTVGVSGQLGQPPRRCLAAGVATQLSGTTDTKFWPYGTIKDLKSLLSGLRYLLCLLFKQSVCLVKGQFGHLTELKCCVVFLRRYGEVEFGEYLGIWSGLVVSSVLHQSSIMVVCYLCIPSVVHWKSWAVCPFKSMVKMTLNTILLQKQSIYIHYLMALQSTFH